MKSMQGPRDVDFRAVKKLIARMELKPGEPERISVDDADVPPWQRQTVWTADEMGLLALSMLRNYPIGLVILWTNDDKVRVPIDGRQRLTAIHSFHQGLVAIPDLPGVPAEYKNKKFRLLATDDATKYEQLPLKDRETFEDYEPRILEYLDIDESTAMDIFILLQGGKSLTKTEVRAAIGGRLCDFVTQLTSKTSSSKSEQDDEEQEEDSHHKFFQQVNLRNVRKAHRNLCDVLLHEYLYPGSNKHWASLDSMYRDKSKTLSAKDQKAFQSLLEKFRKACLIKVKQKEVLLPQLRSAFLILSFFRAWNEVETVYAKPAGYSFADVVSDFEAQREANKKKVPWVNFNAALSNAGYSEGRIEERHEILMSFILRKYEGMSIKDRRKRTFTEAQKIALWDRADHRCEFKEKGKRCTESFPDFRDADADHFVLWSKGGKTSLENGRLLCSTHNRGRGAKTGA